MIRNLATANRSRSATLESPFGKKTVEIIAHIRRPTFVSDFVQYDAVKVKVWGPILKNS